MMTIRKTASALLTMAMLAVSVPAQAQDSSASDAESPNVVTFFCGKTYDSASDSQIPTTLVWQSEKQGNVALIRWKSEYFGMNTQKRCEAVSAKFQRMWNSGKLNYLTTGEVKRLPIICGVANEGDACNSRNQLFTLKPYSDTDNLIKQLEGVFKGESSSPVYESGGGTADKLEVRTNAKGNRYLNLRSLLSSGRVVSSPAPVK
jgi:Circadian oscillating protein COP23